jgi:hypothetical protein
MTSSNFDYEMYATMCAQDKGRWDILKSSINNIRFTVPLGATIVIQPKDMANLPGIAAKYLGSRYLWYTILHYNGLYDSIEDIRVGMTLNIPKVEPLLAALKVQSGNGSNGNVKLIAI